MSPTCTAPLTTTADHTHDQPRTGTRTVHAFAAYETGITVKPFTYEAKELGPLDVEVKIKFCAVCHGDIHLLSGDWGPLAVFPQISGHEIVGEISALGSAVTHLTIGQTVGIGAQRSSCSSCKWCSRGQQHLCKSSVFVSEGGQRGGFADYIRVNSYFAFPVPEGMSPEHAGPLFCGGAAVYTPIAEHCAPNMRVGIVGVGGLGHLAIQFAKARGCETWAISASIDKEADCREWGVKGFIDTRNEAQLKTCKDSFDVLLVTVPSNLDWALYIDLLDRRGKLVFLGAVPGKVEVAVETLIEKCASVHGSMMAGRPTMEEMLAFAAAHNIKPRVELFPFSQINEVLQKVAENKVRYRAVLFH